MVSEDDDPKFEELIKKPVKNTGFMQDEKKQINCPDWKSQLEQMYKTNQDRHQMFNKNSRAGAKAGGVAASKFAANVRAAKMGAQGGAEQTMQPRAPGGLDASANATRSSVGGNAPGEDGAPTKDKKKA